MCVILKVLLQAFEKGFKRAMFDRMDTGELDMGAPLLMRSLCPAIKTSIVPSRSRPMCMMQCQFISCLMQFRARLE